MIFREVKSQSYTKTKNYRHPTKTSKKSYGTTKV